MIAELQAIAYLLASEPLTVDNVVQQLGTVTYNYSGNVLIKPYDPQFKEADVVRDIDLTTRKPSNIPASVDIIPVSPPTVKTLVQAFGPYKRSRNFSPYIPPRISFNLNIPNRPYRIKMIAEVSRDRAVNITLLRNGRL